MKKSRLFGALLVVAITAMLVGVYSQTAIADSDTGGTTMGSEDEDLYFVDIMKAEDGWSRLFRVEVNDKKERVELYPLKVKKVKGPRKGSIPFNTARALAATLDGKRLYVFDQHGGEDYSGTGMLGFYKIKSKLWVEVGIVVDKDNDPENPVPLITMAAFNPDDGKLYAAGTATNYLYVVDLEADDEGVVEARRIGKIFPTSGKRVLNLVEADLAFDYDGDMYIWTNSLKQLGLYAVDLSSVVSAPGVGSGLPAEFIKQPDDHFYTGLAFRGNGKGDLIASISSFINTDEDPHFHIFPKNRPKAKGVDYAMTIRRGGNWVFYPSILGDMTHIPIGESVDDPEDPKDPECKETRTIIAGQQYNAGSVTVSREGGKLKISATSTGGWTFTKIQIYVGATPPPSGSPGQFPYQQSFGSPVTGYSKEISLDNLGECSDLYIAVHLDMHKGEQTETGWAQGPFDIGIGWGMFFLNEDCCEDE